MHLDLLNVLLVSCPAANVFLVKKKTHQVNIKTPKRANPKAPVCTFETVAPTPLPGTTWTQQTDSGEQSWRGMASSSDGTVRRVRNEAGNTDPTAHPCVPAVSRDGGCDVRRLSTHASFA